MYIHIYTLLFIIVKEKEALKRFEHIKQQYEALVKSKSAKPEKRLTSDTDKSNQPRRDAGHKDAKKKIKKALFELYRGAELLKKYRKINHLAFLKIIKQFDKVIKWLF